MAQLGFPPYVCVFVQQQIDFKSSAGKAHELKSESDPPCSSSSEVRREGGLFVFALRP